MPRHRPRTVAITLSLPIALVHQIENSDHAHHDLRHGQSRSERYASALREGIAIMDYISGATPPDAIDPRSEHYDPEIAAVAEYVAARDDARESAQNLAITIRETADMAPPKPAKKRSAAN